MHGLGNDYVMLDGSGTSMDLPSLAVQLCDRHFGAGADGLLVAEPSNSADVRMRMFNPDGSEAEMCGNGIRCFTKYVLENGLVSLKNGVINVQTLNGVLEVTPFTDEGGRVDRVGVWMGQPVFNADDIPVKLPLANHEPTKEAQLSNIQTGVKFDNFVVEYPLSIEEETFNITCVSMGNPHAVAFVDQSVDSIELDRVGPFVENHPMFPQRVNFHVVNVESSNRLRARTWERGAGLTLACGTGACAIQAAARLLGITDEEITLEMPGGDLIIKWTGGLAAVYMEGPTVEVFHGQWL
ncbi:MAG: diaminopimelate epimerase [Chloroflexi bacterium]|jgi:diaminopimelate epimerase|nr:MAG: diaminopimelate epimerase [Chloroflexota bacterium]